jgi:hypothetical protein
MAGACRVCVLWSALYGSQIRTTPDRALTSPMRLAAGPAIRSPGRAGAAFTGLGARSIVVCATVGFAPKGTLNRHQRAVDGRGLPRVRSVVSTLWQPGPHDL